MFILLGMWWIFSPISVHSASYNLIPSYMIKHSHFSNVSLKILPVKLYISLKLYFETFKYIQKDKRNLLLYAYESI